VSIFNELSIAEGQIIPSQIMDVDTEKVSSGFHAHGNLHFATPLPTLEAELKLKYFCFLY